MLYQQVAIAEWTQHVYRGMQRANVEFVFLACWMSDAYKVDVWFLDVALWWSLCSAHRYHRRSLTLKKHICGHRRPTRCCCRSQTSRQCHASLSCVYRWPDGRRARRKAATQSSCWRRCTRHTRRSTKRPTTTTVTVTVCSNNDEQPDL